jgi:DNA-binding protein Fis
MAFGQGVQGAEKIIQGFERAPVDPNASKAWKPISDRKLRVGIVGYGVCKFGADFGFQDHPNVDVVAVSGRERVASDLARKTFDVPLLVQRMIEELSQRHNRTARLISTEAMEALLGYNWPGNIRELRNVIERAVVICEAEQIESRHLASHLKQQEASASTDVVTIPVGTPLDEVERRMILSTLSRTDYNKTRAADVLGISLKTLHNKLKAYRQETAGDEG